MITAAAIMAEEDWAAEVAEPTANVVEMPEVKLFGKWSTDEVQVGDISLQDYIACKVKCYRVKTTNFIGFPLSHVSLCPSLLLATTDNDHALWHACSLGLPDETVVYSCRNVG